MWSNGFYFLGSIHQIPEIRQEKETWLLVTFLLTTKGGICAGEKLKALLHEILWYLRG